jgi:hypothetical protein
MTISEPGSWEIAEFGGSESLDFVVMRFVVSGFEIQFVEQYRQIWCLNWQSTDIPLGLVLCPNANMFIQNPINSLATRNRTTKYTNKLRYQKWFIGRSMIDFTDENSLEKHEKRIEIGTFFKNCWLFYHVQNSTVTTAQGKSIWRLSIRKIPLVMPTVGSKHPTRRTLSIAARFAVLFGVLQIRWTRSWENW